jgi:hypothetical protein
MAVMLPFGSSAMQDVEALIALSKATTGVSST